MNVSEQIYKSGGKVRFSKFCPLYNSGGLAQLALAAGGGQTEVGNHGLPEQWAGDEGGRARGGRQPGTGVLVELRVVKVDTIGDVNIGFWALFSQLEQFLHFMGEIKGGREEMVWKIPLWGRAREGRTVITSYGDVKL